MELAAARLAAIETEDTDEEDDADTIITEMDTSRCVSAWLQNTPRPLAVDTKPHHLTFNVKNDVGTCAGVGGVSIHEVQPTEGCSQAVRAAAVHNASVRFEPAMKIGCADLPTMESKPLILPPTRPEPVLQYHDNSNREYKFERSRFFDPQTLITPAGAPSNASNPLAELTAAITNAIVVGQQQRRVVDLPMFAGSHQYWLAFKAAYKESSPSFSESENAARLRNSLKGRAREAIEELLISGAPAEEIMKTLEARFGRPDAIALSELERLRALPRLTDNPTDICVFVNRVTDIVATLRALDRAYYLYNPEVTKNMIDKFSLNIRYRWYDFAALQPKEEADLLKLSKFLQRESDLCAPYAAPEDAHSQTHSRPQRTLTTVEKKKILICNKANHTAATECAEFTQASNDARWDLAEQYHLCFKCLRVKTRSHTCRSTMCGVQNCPKYHHKLLHFENIQSSNLPVVTDAVETVSCAWGRRSHSYLKILPVQVSGPEGTRDAWALLDDGSTVTLVDDRLAAEVGARGPVDPLHIEAIGDSTTDEPSRRVKITLGTQRKFEVQARTVSNLSLSMQRVDEAVVDSCTHLVDIKSELVYSCAHSNILIGQDNWHLLIAEQVRRGNQHEPVASLTPLGWVLHGAQTLSLGHRVNFVNNNTEYSMDKQLEHYFSVESLTINPARPVSDPDERAKKLLEETTREVSPGKYEAGLLWKSDKVQLPYNFDNALNRLYSIEKKLDKNATLKDKYEEQMGALIEKGYAEPAPVLKPLHKTWHLPHFAVVNPAKPGKVRIVHDAAATTRGVSLNDHLMSGPDLLQSLPGVMMRFRRHRIAVTADIGEMFMRVGVRPEDRDALRYLWRGGERGNTPACEYRMKSLIFGATCSPSTAIFVKKFNATKYIDSYPNAVAAIEKNHYVDDYLDSFRSTEEAIATSKAVKNIHNEGNFDLRGWVSNSPPVMTAMGTNAGDQRAVSLDHGALTERVLGLIWQPGPDRLLFNLNLARVPPAILNKGTPTKREALEIVLSLYDPLGLASPVTVRAKCLLQEAWRRGVDWDARLPEDIAEKWTAWLKHLDNLREIHVPRAYPGYSDASDIQLHVMVDASEVAYAAALYWRVSIPNGQVHVSLVLAKARVAPLKLTSIPRLELQAAVMGARMAEAVKNEHEHQPSSTTFWTDSKTVLQWIRNGSRSYRPFVAHRIAAIEEFSKANDWRWVPTKLNTADDATRDVPQDFTSKHRWFTGPNFLAQEPLVWPPETPLHSLETGEERTNYMKNSRVTNFMESMPPIERFSRWERYVRATARVLHFTQLCRSGTKRETKVIRQSGKRYIKLSTELLRRAETLIVRASQQQTFGEEIRALCDNEALPRNNKLKTVAVKLVDDIIVLNSRIGATCGVTETVKAPPVLDGRHQAAKLYIDYVHRSLHHARVELTVNEVKQRYWVLHLRPATRQLIHRCLPCRIRRAAPPSPPTGNHPACRLAHHQRPFTFTGLDYFGPVTVTVGRSTPKRYVALFMCLTTRAIHLEMANSLTTDSAIMALRRMIARRGCSSELWSDNGTNLRGADKELRRALDDANEEEATRRGINWRFIPPGAPFMGGAWERMVRAVKTALEVTLHERNPSEETFITLLAEAEFTINSRPLTHVSVDPADPEAITPNHFIFGGSAWTPSPGTFSERDLITRTTWRTSQKLADIFWSRWLREYLPELQHRREPRGRGPSLAIGHVVLIADNTLPRNTWPRGLVTAVYPGADGIVRAADVRTKGGVLRRPTKKLVILPTDTQNVTSRPTRDESSTLRAMNGGSNVRDENEVT